MTRTRVTKQREIRNPASRGALERSARRDVARYHDRTATTRGEPSEAIVFRRLVRGLIEARTADRQRPFALVADRLRKSRDPGACVNILLEESALHSGPDGLEVGIDVLSHGGTAVLAAAERFARTDAIVRARSATTTGARFNVHDDVWYMLLRGVARAEIPPLNKLNLIWRTIVQHKSPAVKAAGVHALGDVVSESGPSTAGRDLATELVKFLMASPDAVVGKTAAAVVADFEE